MAESSAGVSVVDTILVSVNWGKDGFSIGSRGGMVWGRGASGGSSGNSQQASGKSNLKKITLLS